MIRKDMELKNLAERLLVNWIGRVRFTPYSGTHVVEDLRSYSRLDMDRVSQMSKVRAML